MDLHGDALYRGHARSDQSADKLACNDKLAAMMRYKELTDGAMSFKGILSSPFFSAFQPHNLLATRSTWLKTLLRFIFLQEVS